MIFYSLTAWSQSFLVLKELTQYWKIHLLIFLLNFFFKQFLIFYGTVPVPYPHIPYRPRHFCLHQNLCIFLQNFLSTVTPGDAHHVGLHSSLQQRRHILCSPACNCSHICETIDYDHHYHTLTLRLSYFVLPHLGQCFYSKNPQWVQHHIHSIRAANGILICNKILALDLTSRL